MASKDGVEVITQAQALELSQAAEAITKLEHMLGTYAIEIRPHRRANQIRSLKIWGWQADRGRDPFVYTEVLDDVEKIAAPVMKKAMQQLDDGPLVEGAKAIGKVLLDEIHRRIDSGVDMAPLSHDYAKRKASMEKGKYRGKPILVRDGKLKKLLRAYVYKVK